MFSSDFDSLFNKLEKAGIRFALVTFACVITDKGQRFVIVATSENGEKRLYEGDTLGNAVASIPAADLED